MNKTEQQQSHGGIFPAYAAAVALVLIVICHLTLTRRRSSFPLPPGPKPLPFVGNALELPREYQERTFLAWGRQYGDLVHARFLRTSVIVVNSLQVARDLMEQRSANYSDRPRFALLGELLGLGDTLPLLPYGDRFRRSYHPLLRRELSVLLKSLVSEPDAYGTHFFQYAAATVMEIAYGHRVTSENDAYVDISERGMRAAAASGSAGSMLIDVFPILQHYPTWMPGSGFKIKHLQTRAMLREMLDWQYDIVKNTLKSGGVKNSSFAANLLEEHFRHGDLSPEDDRDIRGASGTLYGASTESMVSVMRTFILAMVLHPEVLKKAQTEMDKVVGRGRLPDWEDRESLPYLVSVIKEVYRWNVPVPLAVPHAVTRDDVYREFKIPAQSMVIGNIWGMSQDEDYYPEPEKFDPDRFLDMDEDDAADPKNIIFGFGRRICPGKDFADTSLFIVIASIIATMDISKAVDWRGREITPAVEYTSGFARRPKDFVCKIVPRSERARRLIESAEAE
ncbi:hypothetical protein EIP91_006903 [Steccherinum ochraceum]|uniref:Cytochrome P450 n=1 Tax=Steccherinum ochraceum TaxID=92696 RepID=A0A4R0R510_9APHY|nr:hypothetical protein EIP91_006903 [Steccherinum ochraceum]